MLMKPFESSLMATGLRALVHRLNANHQIHAKMLLELQQMEAGDNGEQYLVKQLQKLAYTMNIHILHNVNLQVPVPIQLDVVIVTPYDVIIIECKNIRGNIQLKMKPRQMIRSLDSGEKNIFNHPEVQLEEYFFGLQEFFKQQQMEVNVSGVIVFPFNNASIEHEEGRFPVLMMRELSYFIRQHLQTIQPNDSIPHTKISNLLIEHHRPYSPFPLCNYYKINPLILNKGVYCRSCENIKMVRNKRSWICPSCNKSDKAAHLKALQEYKMLINHQITNEQARDFFEVSDRHVVKRLLQNSCGSIAGHNNKTTYQI